MTDLGLRTLPAPQNYKSPAQVVIIANTQLWLIPVAVMTEVLGSTFGLKRQRGVGTPKGIGGISWCSTTKRSNSALIVK